MKRLIHFLLLSGLLISGIGNSLQAKESFTLKRGVNIVDGKKVIGK